MINETISTSDNPELAQQLVQAAISMSEEEAVTVEQTKPAVTPPPSDEVKLLAGIYNPFNGEVVDTAEIRELNGVDEEALSKISDYGRSLMAILQRGTVKVGEEAATQDVLDGLLSGDREYLILKIRVATFGKDIELTGECPHCETSQTFNIDLEEDVTLHRLEDTSLRSFIVEGKAGEILVEYPDGATQRKLINTTDKTSAELDSILLKNCVTSINGKAVINAEQVKALGMKDRRTILAKLVEKNPGPDLSKLAKNCPGCGLEVPIPLTLADLFRL
jgi:hypothetical protein